MSDTSPKSLRRAYIRSFAEGVRISWPILSIILALKVALGSVIGLVEGWGVAQGIYFSFITGLTIGYGDLIPSLPLTRILAILIGFVGIALSGMVAALAVKAFQLSSQLRAAPSELQR